MRLTIIREDNFVSIDGRWHDGIDMSWLPTYNGIQVHAVQWYGDHGEVELESRDPNIEITELGVFNEAYKLWKQKDDYVKELLAKEEQERLEEEKKLLELEKERSEFLSLFDEEIQSLLESEE